MKYYLVILVFLLFIFVLFLFQVVYVYGLMEMLFSCVYGCFFEGLENFKLVVCKVVVVVGGIQVLYDWNGVNQGNVNGNYQVVVFDGQFCGVGKVLFKGLNLVCSDWLSIVIVLDVSGNFQFVYKVSVLYVICYFDFYIIKDGYNFEKLLVWSDLEFVLFCLIISVKLENGIYWMNCLLFQGKIGKYVIYNVWQCLDSLEVFYVCIDVSFSGVVVNFW